jgi:hypothetical protein
MSRCSRHPSSRVFSQLQPERVGHPEKPNRSLGVDLLEWYHPTVSVRQQKKRERVGHPRKSLEHDIDFANQQDREAIGNAVANHIRQTNGCDVAGDRAYGCPQ